MMTQVYETCSWCNKDAVLTLLGPNDGMMEATHEACGQSTYLEMGD
jgi:hypothetical protein